MEPAVGPLYASLKYVSLEAVRGKAYGTSHWATPCKSKVCKFRSSEGQSLWNQPLDHSMQV